MRRRNDLDPISRYAGIEWISFLAFLFPVLVFVAFFYILSFPPSFLILIYLLRTRSSAAAGLGTNAAKKPVGKDFWFSFGAYLTGPGYRFKYDLLPFLNQQPPLLPLLPLPLRYLLFPSL